MHLTLKQNTARPSGANFLQQQEKFDNFKKEFNNERPHDALAMKYPAEIFKSSKKKYPKELLTPEYPLHDLSKNVTATGVVVFNQTNRFHLSQAFCGQRIGLREEEQDWRVTFVNYDLGYYDEAKKCFTPFDTPQVSTGDQKSSMHIELLCYLCPRPHTLCVCAAKTNKLQTVL